MKTMDNFRTRMHFLLLNVKFYDADNMIHDVVTTGDPFPYAAKFMLINIRNNKTYIDLKLKISTVGLD